jgi:hypothetical protein
MYEEEVAGQNQAGSSIILREKVVRRSSPARAYKSKSIGALDPSPRKLMYHAAEQNEEKGKKAQKRLKVK